MIRTKLPFILLIILTIGSGLSLAQWQIYDCSTLPIDATGTDSSWSESNATNPDEVTEILSVIEDPDIPGNYLLKVDSPAENFKEMWRMNWVADPDVGVTLVFRATAIDSAAYDRGFDVYILNGLGEERFVTTSNGTQIKLDRGGSTAEMNSFEWHIYRITLIGDEIEVFVDEDELSYLGPVRTGRTTTDNYFRFGDGGGNKIGTLYDWIIWDNSGAYPPGAGTPLPEFPVAIEKLEKISPQSFTLAQNYPNPFNPSTIIEFSLKTSEQVELVIYDLKGSIVRIMVNNKLLSGTYRVQWDGRDAHGNMLPSGIYFYSLTASNFRDSKKMTLLK